MAEHKTILLADDDEALQLVVARTLGDDAFRLLYAANGQEALSLATREQPDLILLDVNMPVMDGIDVCRQLRQHPATRDAHIIMLTGRAGNDDRQLAQDAGADDYFVKPFSPIALLRKVQALLKAGGEPLPQLLVGQSADRVAEPPGTRSVALLPPSQWTQEQLIVYARDLSESFRNEQQRSQELARVLAQVRQMYLETISALAHAIDAKDAYTAGHTSRVGHYALDIARLMAPQIVEEDGFVYGLVLHDIGKIGIPDRILTKPERLTDKEYTVIQRHPEIGAQIIQPIEFLRSARPAVLYHHERYDGAGYPHRLQGAEIPLVARIIAVADAWDAMTSDRAYRKALPLDHAVAELRRFRGIQFDPEAVDAMLSVVHAL